MLQTNCYQPSFALNNQLYNYFDNGGNVYLNKCEKICAYNTSNKSDFVTCTDIYCNIPKFNQWKLS